ncbi:DUF6973 domain-containing protein [Aquimarina pacifica]|uniref:DUF6973 domain-containing protein n=1 Tax=Aquimarina pacifica TaxID=1296415 RepID=UPI00046EC0A5|nr:hypothetical protein [Aquimarina pacifica]
MNTKETLRIFFYVLSFSILISCEKEIENNEINEIEALENTNPVITFKGIPVNHRFSATPEDLTKELTKVSLKEFYNKQKYELSKKNNSSATFIETDLPENNLLAEAALNVSSEFPFNSAEENNVYLDELLKEKIELLNAPNTDNESIQRINLLIEKELEKAQSNTEQDQVAKLDMIKNDFSDLSEEEISEHLETINEYYLLNFEYEALKELATNEENIKSSVSKKQQENGISFKIDYDDVSGAYDHEQCVLSSSGYNTAAGVYALAQASLAAVAATEAYFYYANAESTYRDAFRHIFWSGLLAYHYPSVSSKVSPMNFARAIGNANESCRDVNPVDAEQMDYHNNQVGRDLWDDNTSYKKIFGATIGLNEVSVSNLKVLSFNKVVRGCFVPKFYGSNWPFNKRDYNLSEEAVLFKIKLYVPFDRATYFLGSYIWNGTDSCIY